MHIINRGRYAREVYPERSTARSGIIQVGYDQPDTELVIPPTGFSGALFPRDVNGTPLRVVLPGVKPGRFLEVDYRLNLLGSGGGDYANEILFAASAIVTFDGSTAFPGTFQFINNSQSSSTFGNSTAPDEEFESMSALAVVQIPAGATIATVELLYLSTGFVAVDGATKNASGLSATLKATELSANIVSQPGPGNLSPVGP